MTSKDVDAFYSFSLISFLASRNLGFNRFNFIHDFPKAHQRLWFAHKPRR
jgi:hypothetical protein